MGCLAFWLSSEFASGWGELLANPVLKLTSSELTDVDGKEGFIRMLAVWGDGGLNVPPKTTCVDSARP